MRRFHLVRDRDVTGISGTGIVAEGVTFTDGTTVVRWRTNGTRVQPTTVVHVDVQSVIDLHGHAGSTWIDWLDGDPRLLEQGRPVEDGRGYARVVSPGGIPRG